MLPSLSFVEAMRKALQHLLHHQLLFCCVQVHLLVRGRQMRASKAMQDRVLQHSKVSVHLNTVVEDAYADPKGNMGGLMIKSAETGVRHITVSLVQSTAYFADSIEGDEDISPRTAGDAKKLPVRGLFYGIGHQPNSGIVAGQISLDDMGYVQVRSVYSARNFSPVTSYIRGTICWHLCAGT